MRHHKIKSKISSQILMRNVSIWNATRILEGVDVLVRDGIVAKIGGNLAGNSGEGFYEIDGSGKVLLPAGVDAQVHLRVPGQEQKETAWSGTWAAVSGGVGALLNMPNTKPVIDNLDTLRLAQEEVSGPSAETGIKVLFSAAMTRGQKGRECVDFQSLAKAGVSAFTDDGVGVADDLVMMKVLEGAAKTGLPLLQHAEVPGHGGVLASGPVQLQIGGEPYPESAELDMVTRDIRLLRKVPNARYHVLHVSCAKTLSAVDEAKKSGLKVTCEASPHHLYFTADDIKTGNSSFKMNPPLRSTADRHALQIALQSGVCDFMATDHAPHEVEVKTSNFKTSAFGTTGLETSLRVLIWLWLAGRLSKERLVDVWSKAPAKFLGIESEFGEIAEGRAFNAVLCDVQAPPSVVEENQFAGLSQNSCFVGQKLPGRILTTILRDKIHYIS